MERFCWNGIKARDNLLSLCSKKNMLHSENKQKLLIFQLLMGKQQEVLRMIGGVHLSKQKLSLKNGIPRGKKSNNGKKINKRLLKKRR